MHLKTLLRSLLCSLLISSAHAADLVASWQAARAHDAAFAAAQNALSAGLEQAQQGDSGLLPQVTLDGAASQRKEDYRSGLATKSSKNSQGQQAILDVTLKQALYDRAALATREQSHRQSEQAQLRYQSAAQDLILRTAKAYFDVLIAQESVKLVQAQAGAVSEQLALARKMFELGMASITDSNDAQARYDTTAASEITARNDLEIKENAYRRLTGIDPARLVPLARDIFLPPAPEALDALLAQARQQNLELRAQRLGVEVARLEIDRYRLASTPVLSLVAALNNQADYGTFSSSGGNDRTFTGAIGLQLTIPLYTGGGRDSRLRQAVALAEQQSNTQEALQRDVEQQVRQYFLDASSGSIRIRALEQAQVSAASAVASSKLGRKVGVRSVLDVLNAEQAYYQALYNLLTARYGLLLSRLQLAAAVGELQETQLAAVNAWMIGPGAPAQAKAPALAKLSGLSPEQNFPESTGP